MKKIKVFLLSAAIAGAGSAFIPAEKPPGDEYVKVGNEFRLKSSQQGNCVDEIPDVCNYILKEMHGPEPYVLSDFDFNPNETKAWIPSNP